MSPDKAFVMFYKFAASVFTVANYNDVIFCVFIFTFDVGATILFNVVVDNKRKLSY